MSHSWADAPAANTHMQHAASTGQFGRVLMPKDNCWWRRGRPCGAGCRSADQGQTWTEPPQVARRPKPLRPMVRTGPDCALATGGSVLISWTQPCPSLYRRCCGWPAPRMATLCHPFCGDRPRSPLLVLALPGNKGWWWQLISAQRKRQGAQALTEVPGRRDIAADCLPDGGLSRRPNTS